MERELRRMDEEEKAVRAYLYPQFSVSNGRTWLCSLQAWVGYSLVNSRNMVLLRVCGGREGGGGR